MTEVYVMRMVRFWIYLEVETMKFPCGLGYKVQEKRISQRWHWVFWTEELEIDCHSLKWQ